MSCPCRSGWLVGHPAGTGLVAWKGKAHITATPLRKPKHPGMKAEGESGAGWGWLTSWWQPGSPPGPRRCGPPGWDLDSQYWWWWCRYRQVGHRPECQRSCWDPPFWRCLVVVGRPEWFWEEVLECTGVGTGPPQRLGSCWCRVGFAGAETCTGFSWWAFWEVDPLSQSSGFVDLKLKRKAELPQTKTVKAASSAEMWRSCHFLAKAVCFDYWLKLERQYSHTNKPMEDLCCCGWMIMWPQSILI